MIHLDRDVVLLNQSTGGLGAGDMFTYLNAYDIAAALSFDSFAFDKRHAWSIDPSILAIRRNGGRQLLSLWGDSLSHNTNQTSREGELLASTLLHHFI